MTDITATLEAMIDQHGLLRVVTSLSLICSEKAEHIRDNWQDCVSLGLIRSHWSAKRTLGVTAKAWDTDAKTLEKAARLICTE